LPEGFAAKRVTASTGSGAKKFRGLVSALRAMTVRFQASLLTSDFRKLGGRDAAGMAGNAENLKSEL
jgi:hypothetical protein